MIRKMMASDVPQIAALEKRCFSDPWSEYSVASELENPLSLWLVDEREGAVAGYIGSQTVPPEADVMNLAVAPEYRRCGIGKGLMEHLLAALQSAGTQSLTLEVRETNAAALALYTALGFSEVGRRKKYYVNPIEDALIMRKELHDADFGD